MSCPRAIAWQFALGLAALMVGSCAAPPRAIPPEVSIGAAPTLAAAESAAPEPGGVAGFLLGPGDRFRVTVFRHEDLSGQFELDGKGEFAMPLVGEVLGGGMSAAGLEREIEARLENGGYLVHPEVSVEVLNYRPFYVVGEVRNPGSYQYVSGMTVINAVRLAGGFTQRADQTDVVISRGGANAAQVTAAPDTEVLPGDIIEIPERFF